MFKKLILISCLGLGVANANDVKDEYINCIDKSNKFYASIMDTEVSLHTNGSFKPNDFPKTNITFNKPNVVLLERSYNGKTITSEGNEKIIQNVMVLKEFEAFDCSKL